MMVRGTDFTIKAVTKMAHGIAFHHQKKILNDGPPLHLVRITVTRPFVGTSLLIWGILWCPLVPFPRSAHLYDLQI